MTSRSHAPRPPWSPAATAAHIAALEGALNPDARGDQMPPIDGPEEDRVPDWDADHRALAEEDRVWRRLP